MLRPRTQRGPRPPGLRVTGNSAESGDLFGYGVSAKGEHTVRPTQRADAYGSEHTRRPYEVITEDVP